MPSIKSVNVVSLLLLLVAVCNMQQRNFMCAAEPDEAKLGRMNTDEDISSVRDGGYLAIHDQQAAYSSNTQSSSYTRTHLQQRRNEERRSVNDEGMAAALNEDQQTPRQLRRNKPFKGKKGVCMTLRDEGDSRGGTWKENLPRVIALKPYWNYSWNPRRIESQPADIEFVPMLWGGWSKKGVRETILTIVKPQVEAGLAKRLLVFNEPDSYSQANLAVDDAITYWPITQRARVPLGSPACVNAKNSWMTEFVDKLESDSSLRMDYITVHWYGDANVMAFKREMRSIYQYYDKKYPLWITEFAPADWSAATPDDNKYSRKQILSFMKEVLPWLEKQEFVVAYSWFPFSEESAAGTCSALFDASGTMTALGEFYASVNNENPDGDRSIQI